MTFSPYKYDIETWLELESRNVLQKVCNIIDNDGRLIAQYKTRVRVVPVGKRIPHGRTGKLSGSAPSLYRSFSYDSSDNKIASLPEMREWTQQCEDAAQGADNQLQNPFINISGGGGLPFTWDSFSVDRSDSNIDIYSYSFEGTLVGLVTLTYATQKKRLLSSGVVSVL